MWHRIPIMSPIQTFCSSHPANLLLHSLVLSCTVLMSVKNILYILVFEKTECVSDLPSPVATTNQGPFHFTPPPHTHRNMNRNFKYSDMMKNPRWRSESHSKGLYVCMDYISNWTSLMYTVGHINGRYQFTPLMILHQIHAPATLLGTQC